MILTHMVMFSFFINQAGTSKLDFTGGSGTNAGIAVGMQRGISS